MNTVTNPLSFYPRIVTDPTEIDRLRWFQIRRYVDCGLIDEVPTSLPDDPSVAVSTYFGVYLGDEIFGTMRLVRPDNGRLPLEDSCCWYDDVEARLDRRRNSVAEISRLAVSDSGNVHDVFAMLIREFLRYGLNHDHASQLVGAISPPMVRLLTRRMGVPLEIAGPTAAQYGSFPGKVMPFIVDCLDCLRTFQRNENHYDSFFVEGLVIDLVNQPALAAT